MMRITRRSARVPGALAASALAIALFVPTASSSAARIEPVNFGTQGSQSSRITQTTTVTSSVAALSDGGSQNVYELPNGSAMVVRTPPIGFDPVSASDTQLAEYSFPPRPTEASALADWTQVMQAYRSDGPPAQSFQLSTDTQSLKYSVIYTNWAGFSAGTLNTQNTTYVGVKGEMTVPSHSGTCGSNSGIGIWVGLGGTDNQNDLAQQGIECGNSGVGSGGAFRPFTEFANTENPIVFCSQTSWTFPAGDVIYQNMSFYTSLNQAYFYIEDITTGVAHSCSVAQPSSNWSFNGNTADWVVEAPGSSPAPLNFGTIPFSDANAYLGSNGTWVTMGRQSTTKWIEGDNSTTYCFSPSTIGSDNQSFSVSWHSSTCY
jgi:hypothetical protein